jgi:Zn finger protein HypA/HybF involved in hydrogenase expression
MAKRSRSHTKLVPQSVEPPENQSLDALEEPSLLKQEEDMGITELDNEIECPRCNDIMELNSKFGSLTYFCENCSFLLKCV